MARTTLDQRIAKLEAELKNAKASKGKEARKERNGQLMSMGIMLAQTYKQLTLGDREKVRSWAENLDQRTKTRVIALCDSLDAEIIKKEETNRFQVPI